jgi:hypothetical protein
MAEQQFKPGTIEPTDAAAEALQKQADQIEQKYEAPESLTELNDLQDGFMLGGMPARPMSAGIITILEIIKHPMFADTAPDADELALADMMILFYLLLSPEDEAVLVEHAMQGYEHFKKTALVWSFSIDVKVMAQMTAESNKLMDNFNSTMELYADSEGGEAGKKSKTG